MEMEELKIETQNNELIAWSWDQDREIKIELDLDSIYLTLDQATQLRDWLSEMIEKKLKKINKLI